MGREGRKGVEGIRYNIQITKVPEKIEQRIEERKLSTR